MEQHQAAARKGDRHDEGIPTKRQAAHGGGRLPAACNGLAGVVQTLCGLVGEVRRTLERCHELFMECQQLVAYPAHRTAL
jgi:hypothetical protein